MGEKLIEEWFHYYEKDVTSFLVYYTGTMDVEDLVQDTFLIGLEKISTFNGNSHPKTWLISIARNIVIDRYRRKKVWERIKNILLSSQEQTYEMETSLLKQYEKIDLIRAIQQLKPPYKEVVIVKGILELTSLESSEILNCTPNHVNVLYHRALKKIKEVLIKEGFCFE